MALDGRLHAGSCLGNLVSYRHSNKYVFQQDIRAAVDVAQYFDFIKAIYTKTRSISW